MTETAAPPFRRYYLRMIHNVGTERHQETIDQYREVHFKISKLPYMMWLKPTQIDMRWPKRTSDHYIMFASIMDKDRERFEKELFKYALEYGLHIRKTVELEYLQEVVNSTEDEDGEV